MMSRCGYSSLQEFSGPWVAMATAAVAQVSDYELAENFRKQSYGKLEQAMASASR